MGNQFDSSGVPDVPEVIDGDWAEWDSDVELPRVFIPDGIKERFLEMWDMMFGNFGGGFIMNKMEYRKSRIEVLCIENPIKEFCEIKLPDYKACFDLEELAKSEWVFFFRNMLLFIVVCQFISSCVVVLRQS
jgi:hypothetical protein